MESEIVQNIDTSKDWFDYLSLFGDLLVAPIIATVFGLFILKITKRIEHSQWRNQKLVEKRIELWDKISPTINDIYCYCMRVGSWKDFTPHNIVARKREVDKSFYQNRPFFSNELIVKYNTFIETCFDVFQGHGVDAKIKTSLWEHKNIQSNWSSDWDDLFTDTPNNEDTLKKSYFDLLDQVRLEFSDSE